MPVTRNARRLQWALGLTGVVVVLLVGVVHLRELAIAASDILEPINLGSSELVTINQLVDIAEEIGGPVVLKSQVLSGGRMKAGGGLTLDYGFRWDAQLMPETVDPATTAGGAA